MLRRKNVGQSTAEYAIVIGLVIAAVAAMQIYVKRGIQGKYKDASDAPIVGAAPGAPTYGVNSFVQFEPQYSTTTAMVSTRDVTETTTTSLGGGVKREIIGAELDTRSGTQEVLAP